MTRPSVGMKLAGQPCLHRSNRCAMGQVTDTTTFTAEERRAEVDAWLYETCTQCLQHMVDVVALFYAPVAPLLPRIFDLLANFVRCAAAHALPCAARRCRLPKQTCMTQKEKWVGKMVMLVNSFCSPFPLQLFLEAKDGWLLR